MIFNAWQPVPMDLRWEDYAPGAILFHNDTNAVVVDTRRKKDSKDIKLEIQKLDGERYEEDAKPQDPLFKKMPGLVGGDPRDVRAVALPGVIWSRDSFFAPRNIVALLAMAVVVSLFLVGDNLGMHYLAFMAGGGAAMAVRRYWKSGNTVEFLVPDRLGITLDTVLPYVLAREQGKLWIPPTHGANRRQLALQRVEAIRNKYLQLREDIVQRIEAPALFDPAVPATSEFEAALVAFDDVTDATPTERIDALASEVEVTFNVAQANAERLGLEHLPEHARDDARRAGKAARLAQGATTEGEREASLRQVKKILDSLALYYLPTLDERLALEAPPDDRT